VQGIDATFKDAVVQEIRSSGGDGLFTQFRVEFKSADNQSGDGNVYRQAVQTALGGMLSRGPIEVTPNAGDVTGALFFEQKHPAPDVTEKLTAIGLTDVVVTEGSDESGATFSFTAQERGDGDGEPALRQHRGRLREPARLRR
jgi:hypothetical protein